MTGSLKWSIVAAYVIYSALLPSTASAGEVLGKKPRHILGNPSSVPNDHAITKRIWAPGIDDEGRLWSVSEAGSLRWQKWSKIFPLLFRIDPNKLK